jgi:hypothetical protein
VPWRDVLVGFGGEIDIVGQEIKDRRDVAFADGLIDPLNGFNVGGAHLIVPPVARSEETWRADLCSSPPSCEMQRPHGVDRQLSNPRPIR